MSNTNLDACQAALTAAQADFAALQAQETTDQTTIASLNAQITSLTAQVASLQAQVAADAAEEAAENPAPPPPPPPPTQIRRDDYRQAGTRYIAHCEMWFPNGHPKDTSDPARKPFYNQHTGADVSKHVNLLKNVCKFDIWEPNSYAIGSFEAGSNAIYIPECKNQGLAIQPNIDGAVYAGATSIASCQSILQNYIDQYVRPTFFASGISEKWQKNGKYIVTSFVKGTYATAAMWAALSKANPDIEFLTQDSSTGTSEMYWGMFRSNAERATWCADRSKRTDGKLYQPSVNADFNDTNSMTGQSAWGGPARVLPGGGLQHLKDAYAIVNQYKWEYIREVANDYDEGNHAETYYYV